MAHSHRLTSRLYSLSAYILVGTLLLSTLAPGSGAYQSTMQEASRGERVNPRPGAPEGNFPDLNEARQRPPLEPPALPAVPSTIRSPKNPLLPRNGRRVGDVLRPPAFQTLRTPLNRVPALLGARVSRPPGLSEANVANRSRKPSGSTHHARTNPAAPLPLGDNSYVQNFYAAALVRAASNPEEVYWTDILRKAYANQKGSPIIAARELGRTLFESASYAARNRDNHWYVYDLYKAYLMRDPDPGGWAYWESVVPTEGREAVRRAFDESGEFSDLVNTVTPNGSASSAASSLVSARSAPVNQPGSGLLTRDASWSMTLVSLPGRAGLDLGLGLAYSSLVWTRSGPYIHFDEDNGFPSPGFRLGFPTIQERFFDAQTGVNTYLLLTPGGQRVELRQMGSGNYYEAFDSSYLQLIDNSGSNPSHLLVRTMDATQMRYARFNNEWRCTEIKDRNGNFITVNYNWLGQITTVTDTLGRVITFNYDGNANLASITQVWNGSSHTWVDFTWGAAHSLQSSFSGVEVVGGVNGTSIPVVRQVQLHDGTRYDFEYTNALQASYIRRYGDGQQRSYTAFNYGTAGSDCPRLSETRVWAENWSGLHGVPSEVVTQYLAPQSTERQLVAPDGTVYKEFYGSGWQEGLLTATEVWAGGNRQKWTTSTWTQDNPGLSYRTNPRVTETNVYDSAGNRRRTVTSYTTFSIASGAQVSLPQNLYEYDANAVTVLRRRYLEYRFDGEFMNRHLLGLPAAEYLYDGNNVVEAKTTFDYDWPQWPEHLQATPAAPVQHDQANFGAASSAAGRGNLVTVQRWDATDPNNPAKMTEQKLGYWTTGAVAFTRDALGHQANISYSDSFSANGEDILNPAQPTFAYPTAVTDPDGHTAYVRYHFDFGAQTRTIGKVPAGQTQGLEQTFTYDSAARLLRVTTNSNNAYTRFVRGAWYVQSFSTVNTVSDEAYAIQTFDGLGRVVGEASNHPGSTGGYAAIHTIYDVMGRAVQRSNPTEVHSGWGATGDDSAGWLYTQQTYDWNGRPLRTTHPDGAYREASYGGCGCAGGAVVTLTDEGTLVGGTTKRRQQKIYSDVLGRTVKTEVLNWDGAGPDGTNGTVYSATVNTLNVRDQVTQVRQWAGPAGSGAYQDTTMTYDGYGRLKTQHRPEQQVDPNNAASTDHTKWDYNADDTIQKITDARGASQTFTYNNRGLVTAIAYAVPPGSGIADPADASFTYDAAGNRTAMSDGSGSLTYQYNHLSRLISETRTFVTSPTQSYTLSYGYNLAGDLTTLGDPLGGVVTYNRDNAGRVHSVGSTGYHSFYPYATYQLSTLVSEYKYRAWGGLKQTTFANGVTEHTTYNSRLLATSHAVNNLRLNAPPESSGTIASANLSWTFSYYADGRHRSMTDGYNNKFDRRQEFDHAGRLSESFTHRQARGQTHDFFDPDPYRQTFAYDAWGNMTSGSGTVWGDQIANGGGNYTNNRRQLWWHDAEGNVATDNSNEHKYNAPGQQNYVNSLESVGDGSQNFPFVPAMEITQRYDAQGAVAEREQTTRENSYTETEQGPVLTSIMTIERVHQFVRSTVLGGAEIVEFEGGNPRVSIYANGRRIARGQSYVGSLVLDYQHPNPVTGGWVTSAAHPNNRYSEREERDPLGNHTPLSDPSPNVTFTNLSDGRLYLEGGNPWDIGGGCTMDYMPVPCSFARERAEAGTAAVPYLIHTTKGFRYEVVAIESYGVGVFRRWIPGRKIEVEHDDPSDDVVRVWTDETHGEWAFLSFAFQNSQKTVGNTTQLQITRSSPTPNPCGVAIPTNSNDRAVLAMLLGEASTPGESSWDRDQSGVRAYRNPTGTLTEENVYDEMLQMVAVVNNRLRDWGQAEGYSNWQDVVQAPRQFLGYGNGQRILQNLGAEGSTHCSRARLGVAALKAFHDSPWASPFYYWKGIKQRNRRGQMFIRARNGAWRWANTDFQIRE